MKIALPKFITKEWLLFSAVMFALILLGVGMVLVFTQERDLREENYETAWREARYKDKTLAVERLLNELLSSSKSNLKRSVGTLGTMEKRPYYDMLTACMDTVYLYELGKDEKAGFARFTVRDVAQLCDKILWGRKENKRRF